MKTERDTHEWYVDPKGYGLCHHCGARPATKEEAALVDKLPCVWDTEKELDSAKADNNKGAAPMTHHCNARHKCGFERCPHAKEHEPFPWTLDGKREDCTIDVACVTFAERVKGVGEVGSVCRCEISSTSRAAFSARKVAKSEQI